MTIDPSITLAPPTQAADPIGSITVPAIQPAATASAPRMFDEAALNKARQDERDKLYGRLTEQGETLKSMQDELAAMKAERAAEVEAVQAAKAQAEAAQKARAEAEMSAKDFVKQEAERWQTQLAEMERQRAEERAIFEKERAFNELRAYTQAQVAANRDQIAPELLDLVTGNTPEEVDASLETMRTKTAAILEGIAGAQAQARQASLRGVSATGRPNIGPMDTDPGSRTLTPKDISEMSMAEYASYRQHLLAAASDHVRQGGLYR